VTRCPTASALATQHGATVFSAIDDTGLNEAVTAGITHLTAQNAGEVFIMHADLPMATAADIDNVIQAHHRQHSALTLVPDNQFDGTNGMLLTLPTMMQFLYGKNSYSAHLAFASSANISTQTVANAHIGCDIDLWDDFRPLFSLASNTQPRTHLAHWLGQYGKLFEWPLASNA
jgi:2-phospho-L-lactate guanylyltransferase